MSTLHPPEPRRSDDAFARSVIADVGAERARRAKRFSLAPLLALPAAAAAVAIMMSPTSTPGAPGAPGAPSAATLAALVEGEVDAADATYGLDRFADEDLVAFADTAVAFADSAVAADAFAEDFASDFAIETLDGSSEQDLKAIERAFDRALRKL
jgi:hypothetical protein